MVNFCRAAQKGCNVRIAIRTWRVYLLAQEVFVDAVADLGWKVEKAFRHGTKSCERVELIFKDGLM